MKLLVIGNGAREHAIVYKLSQENDVAKIYIASGNAGTANEEKCENVNIKADDLTALLQFAIDKNIDLTVTGGESALALGIVDLFEKNNKLIFGVSKAAAEMESSKSFAKKVMQRANIPTAKYEEFTDFAKSIKYIEDMNAYPIVIKADGLAAGKGVTIAYDFNDAKTALSEIFVDHIFGDSGSKVVIEEFMEGYEATYLAVTDGEIILPLDISQDHKQVYDNDKGPNTGGMGAYAPAPIIDKTKFNFVTEKIAKPMIDELKKSGIIYKGVIYAGLMVNGDDIKVVEFNARFGDPECQVVLSRLSSPLLPLLLGSAKGNLQNIKLEKNNQQVVTVVLTSGGYPKEFKKGYVITGIENANNIPNIKVYHAGTKLDDDKILTDGGRVLSVTAKADTLSQAKLKAYEAVKLIKFTDIHYRTDISNKANRIKITKV